METKLIIDYRSSIRIPRLDMTFTNGESIRVPSRYGGYVISSGCGSGKTTLIKEAILNLNNTGVLYAAATIKECNEMYQYLVQNGEPYGLTKEDIVVLHSETIDDGVDLNMMRRNDEELHDKKVIICTHHKLLNEHPAVLFKFNGTAELLSGITESRQALMIKELANGDITNDYRIYPRQNIFIDEVPTCQSLSIQLDKLKLNSFTIMEYELVDWYNPLKKRIENVVKLTNGEKRIPIKNLDDFKSICNSNIKSLGLYDPINESNRLKNKVLTDMMFENLEYLINSNTDKITLTRTLSDLLFEDMGTRIMLFEGTGDLTFYDSYLFDVLDVKNKYNSPINLYDPIKFDIKRSYKNEKEFIESKNSRDENWNIVYDSLINIINNPESTGTLIICWKGYKIKDNDDNDYIEKYSTTDTLGKYNRTFELPKNIKLELINRGAVSGFEIIHYMSGLDRATNEFRDFNQIIFLGDFMIPNNVVDKFNMDYRVCTTPELFRTYQMIQAISRIRIRNHKGESINIFYTDDIDKKHIDRIMMYLNNFDADTIKESIIVSEGELDFIKPKWRKEVEILCNLDPEFKRSICGGIPYKIDISLDDLYEIIPRGNRKKVENYNPIVNYLRKFNVMLNIESNAKVFGNKQL